MAYVRNNFDGLPYDESLNEADVVGVPHILSGIEVASCLTADICDEVAECISAGINPKLAIVRVGEKSSDLSYERSAIKCATACGVEVETCILQNDATQKELLEIIDSLNTDEDVHGILMFRPLPEQFDEKEACMAIDPLKDVDAATPSSLACVFSAAEDGHGGFYPCTPSACMKILEHYNIDTAGKKVAVIGRSLVVGKPLASFLTARDATVTLCHSKTSNVQAITRQADIVVVACGCTEAIGVDYFSEGQVVIDVGIGWSEEKGKLCGDADFDAVEPIVACITPVPGGVGAVTNAVLISHVVASAKRNLKR